MPNVDLDQRSENKDRSRANGEGLRATISVNEEDLQSILANYRPPILDEIVQRLTAIETALSSVATSAPAPVVEKPTGGVNVSNAERLKAADLRTALLLGKVPDTAGLLIDTRTTARLLSISSRTLKRMDELQVLPEPVRIGGKLVRWRLAEILAWMDAGCPNRKFWKYPEGPASTTRRR
jgi:predicted DNA-binding transcriptional regulator AlpA